MSRLARCRPIARRPIASGTFLTVPGWNGSGPEHWQSIWEAAHPGFRRVEQRDWQRPSRREWVNSIDAMVREAAPPVYLIAHSLGCIAVAHWAAEHPSSAIAGALLVAPPWLSASDSCPRDLRAFLPIPLARLPFPSLLVASENDPYLPIEIAIRLARSWGSELANAGRQGHINVASGHGPWPEGEQLLLRLCPPANLESEDSGESDVRRTPLSA